MSAESAFIDLLHAAERESSRFTHAQVFSWDPSDLRACTGLGVLERIDGTIADCPDCEIGHVGEVHVTTDPAGRDRRHLACPMHGRVEVTAESSREWVVRPGALATAVAKAFGTSGKPRCADRGVWKLGRCRLGDTSREVILLLNASASGQQALATHVGQSGRAIVVTPVREPDSRIWHGAVPAVIPLFESATLEPDGISIDLLFVHDKIRSADAATERSSLLPTDPLVKKTVLAQQVNAVITNLGRNEACVAAYKSLGSYRKAADHLTERTGSPYSKDMVRRAVLEAGGPDAVLELADSGGALRRVASQARDRAKRIAQSGN